MRTGTREGSCRSIVLWCDYVASSLERSVSKEKSTNLII